MLNSSWSAQRPRKTVSSRNTTTHYITQKVIIYLSVKILKIMSYIHSQKPILEIKRLKYVFSKTKYQGRFDFFFLFSQIEWLILRELKLSLRFKEVLRPSGYNSNLPRQRTKKELQQGMWLSHACMVCRHKRQKLTKAPLKAMFARAVPVSGSPVC